MRWLILLLAVPALSQETNCPAYPIASSTALRREIMRTSRRPVSSRVHFNAPGSGSASSASDVNFIDSLLFQQMQRDNIEPAAPADDAEFLRRVTLDITGRIPSAQQVKDYLANTDPGKKTALIDRLIGSKEYTDYWTLWLVDRFQITSDYYNFIGIPGRNLFYDFARNFVASGDSYRNFAKQLIAAAGDSHVAGPPNFTMRGIQYSQPVQDTWDEMTNRVTSTFLGVQTQCVSCHNGRGHLESINLYLTKRTRLEFWRQSAFFARMNILLEPDDASGTVNRGIVTDRSAGGYNSILADPNNPGPRPARTGGPYTPVYMFNGQTPSSGTWRTELADFIVNDRQFARAFVNYLWARLFRVGLVDPPDGFDLARIDASNPPRDAWPLDPTQAWPLQPSHPDLLERLTDEFTRNGYRIAPMIRLMVESRAYGLSGRYEGTWTPLHALDFAKSIPRRLTAEEIYDALTTATDTRVPMTVQGIGRVLYYAGELPDPTEPRSLESRGVDQFNYIRDFLSSFGRGDWWRTARDNTLNPSVMLFFMNAPTVVERTFGNTAQLGNSLVAQLAASNITNEEAVNLFCLSSLGRLPTPAEKAAALSYPPPNPSREQWLGDIQWVFLNESEFFYNH